MKINIDIQENLVSNSGLTGPMKKKFEAYMKKLIARLNKEKDKKKKKFKSRSDDGYLDFIDSFVQECIDELQVDQYNNKSAIKKLWEEFVEEFLDEGEITEDNAKKWKLPTNIVQLIKLELELGMMEYEEVIAAFLESCNENLSFEHAFDRRVQLQLWDWFMEKLINQNLITTEDVKKGLPKDFPENWV